MTHSNSKLQKQNETLQQQLQKAEVYISFNQFSQFLTFLKQNRCTDLVEKLQREEVKMTEVSFLNKQIQNEFNLRDTEFTHTTAKIKDHFNAL